MKVDMLAPGLWRWTTPHPDWTEAEEWPREVGCVYYEAPESTVLIDPLVPADERERERFFDALDRDVERCGLPVAILLTCDWHARSTDELTTRYDAGRETPAGVEPFALPELEETIWWLPEHGALVPGDVLLGAAEGVRVCPDSWLQGRISPAAIRDALRPLLELPVELILVSHGEAVLADARAALELALA
ncbi:MAG: MBL fold metallo-hydrolase [Gaiellaceae bacterium]